jgi:uncharacterized protein (DUF362 family)
MEEIVNRRDFLLTAAGAGCAPAAVGGVSRLALVGAGYAKLSRPASPEDALNYEQVREMVWTAIALAPPKAGSLDAKIKPGSWVVVKPNIVFLRPHPAYAKGDITDFRVTQAVLEYVARFTRAGRVTLAEGGTYRNRRDTAKDNVVLQGGERVTAYEFDWGSEEFPGWAGSIRSMLADLNRRFPGKTFDYVDLSYDAVRDATGAFRRVPVPVAANGVGAFGGRSDYFVTNTITKCDFLINVPVMKVHLQSGITAVLKNYVGTAPREAYATPGVFHNAKLHAEHSAGGRICPFIVDLAAFHPPDYCVVDAIRGLQCQEHSIGRADQTVRTNLVFAGEDPVLADAMAAKLMGFAPWDMEFLHLAARRGMGSMELEKAAVVGDDAERFMRRWEKPKQWYGRCNREWRLRGMNGRWEAYTAPYDTVEMSGWRGAAAEVAADRHVKGYLWLGVRGKVGVRLDGERITELMSDTTYRVGQFQLPVELKPGVHRLEFDVEPVGGKAALSLLVTGWRNDGDTAEGIRWVKV